MDPGGRRRTGDPPPAPVAGPAADLVDRLEALGAWVRDLDWRMHDLVVVPVTRIEERR